MDRMQIRFALLPDEGAVVGPWIDRRLFGAEILAGDIAQTLEKGGHLIAHAGEPIH